MRLAEELPQSPQDDAAEQPHLAEVRRPTARATLDFAREVPPAPFWIQSKSSSYPADAESS
eukprot:4017043-Alexandrium_andersonii.AAC.1